VTAAAKAVAASSPRRNRGGGTISVLATILSGDSLSRCPVSGHEVIELITCGAFLVLFCAAGDFVSLLVLSPLHHLKDFSIANCLYIIT
jgi:hypothetical protein